ncbi:hypothetical protein [Aquimarina sp. AU474]|uniref:tetratricopeptide repeat protein n=1 Tax=Aquimarina sp. AU474 TaxID=2108529 RepID=UPI00135AEDE3|nr:hypothetical protein [Aquimarina sp. AU474]
MKISNIICVLMIGLIITSCNREKSDIINPKDYNVYLDTNENTTLQNSNLRLQFWNKKIKEDSLQIMAMANAAQEYSLLFRVNGDISNVKKAEQLLTKTVDIAAIKKEGYLLTLAQNYISQHRFKEAKNIAFGAYVLNPDISAKMVLFDVSMELGEYQKAEEYLNEIADQNNYNFLIRLAKWNDYKGNLDATIRNMEKAKIIAEQSKKVGLMLWSYTNLADYYGHAGRIQDSYEHYLKALQIDPSNAYAKKGIAWIAYSHEKNSEEALRIINKVLKTYQSPDYFLFKAEIVGFQDNKKAKRTNIEGYLESVKDKRYGEMYNVHNALLLAEEYQDYDKALQIAEKEIANRPTPQSYDLKAYILNLKGSYKEALHIANTYVVDQTFEPTAHLHMAQIFKSNELAERVTGLKEELLESAYELGPVTYQEIKSL